MKPTTLPASAVSIRSLCCGRPDLGAVGSYSNTVPAIFASTSSIRSDVRLRNDLDPALDFRFDIRIELLRTITDGFRALREQLLGHVRRLDDFHHLGVQFRN